MEVQAKNITGTHIGKLTVIRQLEEPKNGHIVYECLCDCGNTVYALHKNLIKGSPKSCGCLQSEMVSKANRKDLTGQRFGRLIAVRPTERRECTSIVWECICDCGNTAFVTSNHLIRGLTRSCGCLRKEQHAKDLTGQRFGTVVVVAPTEQRYRKYIVWKCICDCGKVNYIPSCTLIRPRAKLCECAKTKKL